MEDKKVDNTINSFMDSDSSSDSTSLEKANDKPADIDAEKKSPEKEHCASLSSPPMSPILLKSTINFSLSFAELQRISWEFQKQTMI